MTPVIFQFFILMVYSTLKLCHGNWVHGGSFETRSSRWQFHIRPNLWDFSPSVDEITYSDDVTYSGKKSLKFLLKESPGRLNDVALVGSQFLQVRNSCVDSRPLATGHSLKLAFHIKSSPSSMVYARLDVR